MSQTRKHEILVVEDNAENAAVLCDIVRSMDFGCQVATTLEEVREILKTFTPCGILQDMQIPYRPGARPHEKAGESSIALGRAQTRGKARAPIIVVTAYRSDPDFVWSMSELEADGFVAKDNIGALADKLKAALKKNGRELHTDCAVCNAESRPPESIPRDSAVLFSRDERGTIVDAERVKALHATRDHYDLFLDTTRMVDVRGYLAGFRDHKGVAREVFLSETSAMVIAELVEARRPLRADTIPRLKQAGHASAVRLVQTARKAVDLHAMVRGKESRRQWRSFHTVPGKGATAIFFDPPAGLAYAVIVPQKRDGA